MNINTGDLWSYFEERFGPVVDAVVIGSQTPDHKFASRGFGFVTFRFDQSVTAAIKEHYVILFGKKVRSIFLYFKKKLFSRPIFNL